MQGLRRRDLRLAGILAAAAGLVMGLGGQVLAERPNLVLIVTDDQGYGDFGVTGNPVIRTPNLDGFARESASMDTFYVSPVCSPTRASLMTGRYNYRTRVVDTYMGRSMMDPEEVTVAEVLAEAGYANGVFGKWHLGDSYPLRPGDQGFEESLIHRGGGLAQPSEPLENERRYTNPILFRNGEQVPTQGYCTDVYFNAAQTFIRRAKREGRPFFVYLATNAPHGPFHDVPEDLYAYYAGLDLSAVVGDDQGSADRVARVFAMVENIDQNVGQLTRFLRALDLEENTLVAFLVDNGPNSNRYVGPFRGSKTQVHEGGIRSPFWVRWPARLKPGVASDRIAAHIDVMPTLLEAAGVPIPAGLRVDGRSLLPLLEGKEIEWPDRHLVIQSHRGNEPVAFHHMAIRNQRWKLVHPTGFGRYAPAEGVPFELYEIEADPGETRNLASRHPNVVRTLQEAYQTWLRDVSSTRPDNYAPPRMLIGTDAEPVTVLTRQDWRVRDTSGWGEDGAWLLQVPSAGRFDVQVLWNPPLAPGSVDLHIGELHQTVDEPQETVRTMFRGVDVPRGPCSLSVVASRGAKSMAPYHVKVKRVGGGRPGTSRP